MGKKITKGEFMTSIKETLNFVPTTVLSLNKNGKLYELIGDTAEFRWTNGKGNDVIIPLSTFNPYIAEILVRIWSKPNDILLNPFSGRGTQMMVARELGRNAIVYEIVPEYCQWIIKRINEIEHEGKWNTKTFMKVICGDARNMTEIESNSIDCIITSPPFWNVEKYQSVKGQMSDAITYDSFLIMLNDAFKEFYRVMKKGGWVIIESNFFRVKGVLYPFMDDVKKLVIQNGFILNDEIIEVLYSYTPRGIRNNIVKGHLPKTHCYIDVFFKPPFKELETEFTLDKRPIKRTLDNMYDEDNFVDL